MPPYAQYFENPYQWTSQASALFIDNPAGVGFSFAARKEDLYNNDMSDSWDLFNVMRAFYSYWPELLARPLFVGGQSYGGAYAPYLAWRLHVHNQEAELTGGVKYPLSGMIIANGVTDFNFDFFAKYTPFTYTGFNIFPEPLLKAYEENNCIIPNPLIPRYVPTPECEPIVLKMLALHDSGLDIYDLLRMPNRQLESTTVT